MIPRFGNLLWALECLQQCKNFSGIIVLQFVGRLRRLCCGANGDLLQEDFCHTPRLPGLLQPEPLSPWQVTSSGKFVGVGGVLIYCFSKKYVYVVRDWKVIRTN